MSSNSWEKLSYKGSYTRYQIPFYEIFHFPLNETCTKTLWNSKNIMNKMVAWQGIFKLSKEQWLKDSLTVSWRSSLSYRNQSIDLLFKYMDWFLYDNGPRHERVNNFFSQCSSLIFTLISTYKKRKKSESVAVGTQTKALLNSTTRKSS